jgi:hypothetical protein
LKALEQSGQAMQQEIIDIDRSLECNQIGVQIAQQRLEQAQVSVWCMGMESVWCVVYGVWCVVQTYNIGPRCMVYGVWCAALYQYHSHNPIPCRSLSLSFPLFLSLFLSLPPPYPLPPPIPSLCIYHVNISNNNISNIKQLSNDEAQKWKNSLCDQVCMCVCVYVCMYVCKCVCVY